MASLSEKFSRLDLKKPITAECSRSCSYDTSYTYGSGEVLPVVHLLNPGHDWIVINRHGMLIWVSNSTPIFDIDDKSPTVIGQVNKCAFESNLPFRLYETCRGLRLIILSKFESFDDAHAIWQLMKPLPIDPKYTSLCTKQKCFRARLSTKPLRSENHSIVASFELGDEFDFEFLRDFYHNSTAASSTGVTRLLECNVPFNDPAFTSPIRFHDVLTGAMQNNCRLA